MSDTIIGIDCSEIKEMSVNPGERRLAEIVTISSLNLIPKADKIVLANFKENTWQVVVAKDQFNVGDLVIYFSIDSILETNSDTEFLKGKHLKTRKMLNVISQGLVGPLSWLSQFNYNYDSITPGTDVTHIMRVQKYIAPEEQEIYQNSKKKQPTFPLHLVPQTDEHRIQNSIQDISTIISTNSDIIVTTKYDGTSCTIIYTTRHNTSLSTPSPSSSQNDNTHQYDSQNNTPQNNTLQNNTNQYESKNDAPQNIVNQNNTYQNNFQNDENIGNKSDENENIENKSEEGRYIVCSRNNIVNRESGLHDKYYFEISDRYGLDEKMKVLGRNIAIQGEICGPKVNNNRLKRSINDFFVFNIWDIDKQNYLLFDEVKSITDSLGLKMVPLLYRGKIESFLKTKISDPKELITAILDYASNCEYSKGVPAEGIVIKTDSTPRISFKVISNKYLLKYDN